MGKALVDAIVDQASDALDEGGTPSPPLESRARNNQMHRAKSAIRRCQRELQHRIKYGEPTDRCVGQIVSDMTRAVNQWNLGFLRWQAEQQAD